MRTSPVAALVTVAIATLAVSLAWAATRRTPSGPIPPPAPGATTVIELFTSQGCSSCPPADQVLSALGSDPELADRVFPLAFHVDYWNQLGWTDPFSSAEASDRQREYAESFGSPRIYTPQLVVGGTTECVGSNEEVARELIARALGLPPRGTLELSVSRAERAFDGTVAAALRPGVPRGEVWLAVVESGLATAIPRGENARRHLANDYVVRRFERLGELSSGASERRWPLRMTLDPGWKVDHLAVVVFLQDPRSREILAAARSKPAG